jgi:hypothetical protein
MSENGVRPIRYFVYLIASAVTPRGWHDWQKAGNPLDRSIF